MTKEEAFENFRNTKGILFLGDETWDERIKISKDIYLAGVSFGYTARDKEIAELKTLLKESAELLKNVVWTDRNRETQKRAVKLANRIKTIAEVKRV